MNIFCFFSYCSTGLSLFTAFLLALAALILTFYRRFIQIRALPTFMRIIHSATRHASPEQQGMLSPLQALFTAMSTSIGIGTIVGPSIAIIMGGPGALGWLILYGFFGSVLKFTEVYYALRFRKKLPDGSVIGGPMPYLEHVHRFLGKWYVSMSVLLFIAWSSIQANVLADILACHAIPPLLTGISIAFIVVLVLHGRAARIGTLSSYLVPIMTTLYAAVCFYILILHAHTLPSIIKEIIYYTFTPHATIGGFLGASLWQAARAGIYRGAYITESGIGTSTIPHSLTTETNPYHQGILAMVSVFADTLLCTLSGLLVLTAQQWHTAIITNRLMYTIFEINMPYIGKPILLITIILFAISTIIGNSFNGKQSFTTLTGSSYTTLYIVTVSTAIITGAMMQVPLVWQVADFILPLIAIPHIFALLYLSFTEKR